MTDSAAVEAAVRAFLDEMLGSIEAPGKLDLRRLDVVQVSAGRATAELAASATWALDHPVYGRIVRTEDLSGPVELERSEAGWRVVDVTVDGRPRSKSTTEVPGWIEEGGLRIGELVLDLGGHHTTVTFTVENGGALPVVVFEALRGVRSLGVWTYSPVPLMKTPEVEPSGRRGARAGWREVFPLDTEELRFVVRAGQVGGPRRLELHFAARRAPRPELVPLGPPPWSARLSARRRRRLQLVPLAAVAVPLALRWFRVAGIVFALLGLVVAAQIGFVWLIRRGGRPNSRAVAAALAAIAVGVWLAWLDPS